MCADVEIISSKHFECLVCWVGDKITVSWSYRMGMFSKFFKLSPLSLRYIRVIYFDLLLFIYLYGFLVPIDIIKDEVVT